MLLFNDFPFSFKINNNKIMHRNLYVNMFSYNIQCKYYQITKNNKK